VADGSIGKEEPAPETWFGGQDMKTKTLLLGSAAALLMAGGAQAADLSIAAPVDYVRVCDAFGVGYWYIPGTDTCLKIGGYVQFDIRFRNGGWYEDTSYVIPGELEWEYDTDGFVTSIYYGTDTFVSGDYHSSHWKFITEAAVDFTASSMTEYGLLESYAKFVGKWDYWDDDASGGNAWLDAAWLRLGHVRMGKFGSVQNYAGGYSPGAWDPDFSTNQIELSWAASGFGLMLGIEDPQNRWHTELTGMPNLAGAATFSAGHLDVKVTAGWSDVDWGSAYGISGVVSANMDQFSVRVGGAWANAPTYLGGADVWINGDSNWQAYISAIFRATSQVSIAGTFAYAANADTGFHATSAGAALVWAPVAGFSTTVEGKAWKNSYDDEHDWEAKIRFKRTFP
jgi:hypothetical protein